MSNKEYFKELVSVDSKTVSIHRINSWLIKYKDEFDDAISKSNCGKWSKWVRDNSIHVFPCACPSREQDCIFIEMYFKLLKVIELNKREGYYAEQLVIFYSLKNNKDSVIEWVRDNESTFKALKYKLKIDSIGVVIDVGVNNHNERYKRIIVRVSKEEFIHTLEFKRIFEKMVDGDYI